MFSHVNAPVLQVPDIIDNAYVIVEFKNGSRGILDLCMFAEGSKNEQEISVVGDIGKVNFSSMLTPPFLAGPLSCGMLGIIRRKGKERRIEREKLKILFIVVLSPIQCCLSNLHIARLVF